MKALIAALITLVFLFTAPAFAGKSGGAGKGNNKREHVKTHKRVMDGEKGDNIREMKQKKLKQTEEIKEEKQEDKKGSGKTA